MSGKHAVALDNAIIIASKIACVNGPQFPLEGNHFDFEITSIHILRKAVLAKDRIKAFFSQSFEMVYYFEKFVS